MPIKLKIEDILRIRLKDKQIWRVYNKDQLIWGYYLVNYNFAEGINDPDNPKDYVWGIKDITLLPAEWEEADDFMGWYDSITLERVIDKISKDDHLDFNLYAKWVKHKLQYRGWYTWTEPFTPTWTIRTARPTVTRPDVFPYTNDIYWGWSPHTCAWYCYGRTAEAAVNSGISSESNAFFAPNGNPPWDGKSGGHYGDAKDWINSVYAVTDSTVGVQPGNVVICTYTGETSGYKPGHVLFIERVESTRITTTCTAYGFPYYWDPGALNMGQNLYNIPGDSGYFTVIGYIDNPQMGGTVIKEAEQTEWSDNPNPPKGSWKEGYPETRGLESVYDYESESWGEWREINEIN